MSRQFWAGQRRTLSNVHPGKRFILVIFLAGFTAACSRSTPIPISTATQTPASTVTSTPSPTPTMTPSPSPTPTLTPSPSPTVDMIVREHELLAGLRSLLNRGDSKGAIKRCTEAISADPTFALAYALRGMIYLQLKDLEAAVNDFDQAFELGIASNLDKEIEPGLTLKSLYYYRGSANMVMGSYQQGIEDLERFQEVTEPLENARMRADAQYQLSRWHNDAEQVSGGQEFDFEYFSIRAPQGQNWGNRMYGPQSIEFGRTEKLDDQGTIYGERTTIALTSVSFLGRDYSRATFLPFACAYMAEQTLGGGRNQAVDTDCDYWEKSPDDCVSYSGLFEDGGPSDMPFNPPLMLEGYSLLCRHPDFSDVIVYLHFSQRGPKGSLQGEIEQQAEEFFSGVSYRHPAD